MLSDQRAGYISRNHHEPNARTFGSGALVRLKSNLLKSGTSFTPLRQRRAEKCGGARRDRTADPLLAKQVLSQLSYSPKRNHVMVGLGRLELPTSPLSGVRSNQTELQAQT